MNIINKFKSIALFCLSFALVLIVTKVLWQPFLLRYSIYLNPVISWRLYDCKVKSIEYDMEGFGGRNDIIGLLMGNVKEMIFNCENKASSKIGITYNFTFAIDGYGKRKESCSQGHTSLNTRIYKLIEKAESCDAVAEIVKKNNIKTAQLGLLTLNQERHLNAVKYEDNIIWDIDKKQLFISNLPWKDYKYLPGHSNSLTAPKDTSVVLSSYDTILRADCYPCHNIYKYKFKFSDCKEGVLETNCDDRVAISHNWMPKIDTVDISFLKYKVLRKMEAYGLRGSYLKSNFNLVQAKALKRLSYKYANDHYNDNSSLWGRCVFKWGTGIRCIDDFKGNGLLICVYFTYYTKQDSFEMIRVGTSVNNMYSQIKFKEIAKLKSIYQSNYSLSKNLINKKEAYIKILPDGNLAIKWDVGELNLGTGKIDMDRRWAMSCIMPDDVFRYRHLDYKFPLNKIKAL
ncbi:MAG: hypothetical protein RDU76_04590 [Candidatus Edwardsbacteria bacterium]|nr:hypothetical protein [Candidatus Edwardsbacteria bacterium]